MFQICQKERRGFGRAEPDTAGVETLMQIVFDLNRNSCRFDA